MRRLVVVGLDPGATVGFAVLGLDGVLLKLGSLKGSPIEEIISQVIQIGVPVVVGTDKASLPAFVEKFASCTGARAISPKKDMRISEKGQLLGGQVKGNSHERDALASAAYAYKRSRLLIEKLTRAAFGIQDEAVKERAFIRVLRDEGINIANELRGELALKLPKPEPRLRERHITKPNPIKLLRQEFALLKAQNTRLAEECERLKLIVQNKEKSSTSNVDHIVGKHVAEKNEQISLLKARIQGLESTLQRQQREIVAGIRFVSGFGQDKVLIKLLPNLNWETYRRLGPALHIKEGDVILADSLENWSQKAIDEIRIKVGCILYRQRPSKFPPGGFVFLNLSDVGAEEFSMFALVDKARLSSAMAKHSVLNNIVEEYKKRFNQ